MTTDTILDQSQWIILVTSNDERSSH